MLNKIMEWFGDFSSPWTRLGIALIGGIVVGIVVTSILRALESRTKTSLIRETISSIRPVAFIVCVVLAMRVGVSAFPMQPDTAHQVGNAFSFGIFLLGTWAVNRVYDIIHEHAFEPLVRKENQAIDGSLLKVIRTIAHTLLWVLGIGSGLNSAGYDITAILAGLGIGGLALALAAQDTVANLFGGVVVLTQAPFKVGDRIKVKDIDGWVADIGLRATVINDWYGQRIVLPNRAFTDNPVTNVDARKQYWEELRLKLRHDCSVSQIQRAIAIIRELASANKDLVDTNWVALAQIGDGFFEIEVWIGIKRFKKGDTYENEYHKISCAKSDFLLGVMDALHKQGIFFATPVAARVVHQAVLTEGHFWAHPPHQANGSAEVQPSLPPRS